MRMYQRPRFVPNMPYTNPYQQPNNMYYGQPQQMPYPHQNTYHQPQMNSQQMWQQGYYQQSPYFENPLLQEEYNPYKPQGQTQGQSFNQMYANPYPKASFMGKPQTKGINSIMNSFKSQDGSFDFNKMMDTAGQMMGAVNQVSSMVKGLGGIFKT